MRGGTFRWGEGRVAVGVQGTTGEGARGRKIMIRMWCIHDNIYIVYDGPIKCDGCPMPTAFEKKGRRGRKGRMRPRPRPRTSQRPRPRPRPLSRFFLCFCRTHQQTASSGSIRNSSNRRAKIRVKTPARSPLVVPVSSTGVNTKRSFRICPVLRQKIQKLAIWPKPLPLPAAAAAVLPEVRTAKRMPASPQVRAPHECQRAADPGDGDGGGRQKGHDMYGREGFAFAICGGKKNLSEFSARSGHNTYFFSSIWMAWYHPMPRLGAPQPTRTTSA